MQVDRNHNQADLSLRGLDSGSKISSATAATAPEGTLLLGQVVTASAGLVRIHVGRRTYGKVAVTDIHDGWVDNPMKGIAEGMYVKCCVVKASGPQEDALHLSLQASKGASWPGQAAEQSPEEAATEAVTSVDQLKEGQQVCHYPIPLRWVPPHPQHMSCRVSRPLLSCFLCGCQSQHRYGNQGSGC